MQQNYVSTSKPEHTQNIELPIIDNIEDNEFLLPLQLLNEMKINNQMKLMKMINNQS
jgi:hypothetical protein